MLHAIDSTIDGFFKVLLTVKQNHYLLSPSPKAFLARQTILSLFWWKILNTCNGKELLRNKFGIIDDRVSYEHPGVGRFLSYLFIKMRNPSTTSTEKSKP